LTPDATNTTNETGSPSDARAAAKAAVIAVGSELLSGQITNRNAAWVSAALFDLGIDSACHMTVDDVEADIVGALELAARRAGLIVVTGGLGPTSDDLTRNAVARWAGRPLEYHEPSWRHIETMFARFSRTVPETNRQQCWFPAGATVLANSAGTANAFALSANGCRVFVLPGPPREVETIWTEHVAAEVATRIPPSERKALRMWRTIGKGESHLAEVVEPLVSGRSVEVAYRAHAPFVETKVRFPVARAKELEPLCAALDAALAPWVYEVDREDVQHALARRLAMFQTIDVYDGVTRGNLVEVLAPELRAQLPATTTLSSVTSWESNESPREFVEQMLTLSRGGAEVHLALAGFDASGTWAIGARMLDERTVIERPSLYKGEAMQSRNLKAIAALACRIWLDALTSNVQ
jgi:molybdenum cofactor synthesis domain-containing protein